MPIYAYRCDACGFQKDHLQKLSDPVLSTCPECGAAAYSKQVTAAGFQLKGNGWYATDFKGGPASATATQPKTADDTKTAEAAKAPPPCGSTACASADTCAGS